ncbi:MAG: toprim domain-containing protein [Methylomonas sp.]|jgi:putative DNA primase/helicase|uniref:toprim domain-containing protein n=1 Tax=Methylomonas sp. TaxID=418 RepID=UPI0025F757A4|nr:toprim domain-containing protein [Methylomonas sp.]MCK9609435.1 toprim domain-containing protein [Methylomonas sp.]
MAFLHIEDAARAALVELGLCCPKSFEPDRFHVVDAEDGKRGNGAGRIKVFADGKGGYCQNWKTGERRSFFLDNDSKPKPLTKRERARIERERRKRQAEAAAKQDQAAKRALSIWQDAKPAPEDHPYLSRKQIKPHGARLGRWRRVIQDKGGNRATLTIENALLLPLFDPSGTIRSLQAIFPAKHPILERDKDFLPAGGLAGLFWWVGQRSNQPGETVLIAEGFATAATLHEQTGHRVYMAFTAGNLLAVGRVVRERLPSANIVFAADNDTKTAGNPGLTKATEAAAAVGGSVAVPPIHGDFNDYQLFLNGGGHDE